MALVICAACGKQHNYPKLMNRELVCRNCGATASVVVRGAQVSTLLATTNREGVDRRTARYRTYAGLRKFQEVKGFKPGFIAWKFKEMFGEWPNGETGTPAEPMTHELGLWLRRAKGRYAAQRAKEKKNSTAGSLGREGRIAMLKRQAEMMKQWQWPTS